MRLNWHLRRLRLSDIALTITVVVLLGFSIVLLVVPTQDNSFTETFTPEHVQLLEMHNTAAQRTAHRAALIALAALTLAAFWLISRRDALPAAARVFGGAADLLKRYAGILIALGTAVFLIGIFQAEAWKRGVILIRLGEIFLAALIVLFFLFFYRRFFDRQGNSKIVRAILWFSLIVYLLWLIVPGFVQPLYFFPESQIWVEGHYNVTLAQGDRLAAGLRLGSEVNLNYGLLPPLFLAVYQRAFGWLDFGGHFTAVQVTQMVFLLLSVAAFYVWRPRRPLLVLFAALLIGTWVSTSHSAIYFPNQAGWRFVGLALGVLFLLLARSRTFTKTAFFLGFGSGFLILYNPETGICLTFGYGLFLLSRLRTFDLATLVRLGVYFLGGAAIACLTVILFYRIGLGEFPTFNPQVLLGFIGRFGEGYSGLPLKFDPFALIIFVYSVYILALTTLRWRQRKLTIDESVRLALSATILVWFAYYFNRPDPWNLWTFQFLFVFLIADWFNPATFSGLRRMSWANPANGRLATMLFVLLPFVINQNYLHLKMIVDTARQPPTAGQPIKTASGVPMSEKSANSLLSKAAYLEKSAPDTLFFTANCYSLSLLSKRFIKLPIQDVFGETITKQDFENVIGIIRRDQPRTLLFETFEANPPEKEAEILKYYESFFGRVKTRLADQYRLKETKGDWEVWELNSAADDSSPATNE